MGFSGATLAGARQPVPEARADFPLAFARGIRGSGGAARPPRAHGS